MSKLKPSKHLAILIGGDLLVILSFIWAGRTSHGFSLANILAQTLSSALPFIIGWFVIMPWLGLFRDDVSRNRRKLVPRLLLGWVIAGPLALILRALLLGRPIPAGIIPTFAMISLTYIGLVTLVWRLVYIWWHNRSPKQPQKEIRSAES